MSQHDRIDPESREPLVAMLEVLPGGVNAIADVIGCNKNGIAGFGFHFEVGCNLLIEWQFAYNYLTFACVWQF